jgi:glycine/D-amino acid oxidase-like deaminating enzyme
MPDVVVVGGGIAGCTVAFELARRGARVSLLERKAIGAAASGRNTGTLLQQAEPEVSQLLRESIESYKELADGAISFGLQERTQLLLAFDEPQLDKSRLRAEAISRLGGQSKLLPRRNYDEPCQRWPQASPVAILFRAPGPWTPVKQPPPLLTHHRAPASMYEPVSRWLVSPASASGLKGS